MNSVYFSLNGNSYTSASVCSSSTKTDSKKKAKGKEVITLNANNNNHLNSFKTYFKVSRKVFT